MLSAPFYRAERVSGIGGAPYCTTAAVSIRGNRGKAGKSPTTTQTGRGQLAAVSIIDHFLLALGDQNLVFHFLVAGGVMSTPHTCFR